MLKKCDYRSHFAQCSRYVKFSNICKDLKINQPSFSMFMKGFDWYISMEKLEAIEKKLAELSNIIA